MQLVFVSPAQFSITAYPVINSTANFAIIIII